MMAEIEDLKNKLREKEYQRLLEELNKSANGITLILSYIEEMEKAIYLKEEYYRTKGYYTSCEVKCRDYEMVLTREIPPTLRGLKAHFDGMKHSLNELNKIIMKKSKEMDE